MDVAAPYEVEVQPQVAVSLNTVTSLPPSSPKAFQLSGDGVFNGNLGVTGPQMVIGTSGVTTGYGLYVRPSLTGAAFQIGVNSSPVVDATATSWGAGVYGGVRTAAASFTLSSGFALAAASPSLGAGSSITSMYGLYIYNQGATGVANAYGVMIASQSGATTTNMGLWNQGTTRLDGQVNVNGMTQFSQPVSIGNQAAVQTVGLNMVVNLQGQGVSGVGADQVCQKIVGVFSSVATSGMGLYFQPTSGNSNTFSSIWAFYIDGSNLGTSPVTNYYGLYVRNQARSQTTNTYGIYIENQSGSPTTNLGLYNGGTTLLMGAVGVAIAPVAGLTAPAPIAIPNGLALDNSNGQSQAGQLLAPGATWTAVPSNFSGLVVVDETIALGYTAMFLMGAGASTLVGQNPSNATQWSATQGHAGSINIYFGAPANGYPVMVENQLGSNVRVSLMAFRLRYSA